MADKKWWDASLEPKRNFRWEIEYTKGEDVESEDLIRIPSHYITSVKMPSFSFQKEEQDQIGAKRVTVDPHPTFSPVEITFIDDQDNTIYNWLYWYFYNAGIKLDGSGVTTSYGLYNYQGFYSFSKASNFFGNFKIYTLGTKLKQRARVVTTTETVSSRDASGTNIQRRTPENQPVEIQFPTGGPLSAPPVAGQRQPKPKPRQVEVPDRTVTTQNTIIESNHYRIDEIELVKPFIVDFKQSDLNYSEDGFISYTITINYATYKYSNYNEGRDLYNTKLGMQYGTPPKTSRGRTPTGPVRRWSNPTKPS